MTYLLVGVGVLVLVAFVWACGRLASAADALMKQ